jgi:hypothetical protein
MERTVDYCIYFIKVLFDVLLVELGLMFIYCIFKT